MRVTPVDPDAIRASLKKILRSEYFSRSPQARKFFEFVTEFALNGEAEALKAYTIGVSALSVNADRSCPETTARMQASRVRRFLSKYYAGPGQGDAVEIRLPTGSYVPLFVARGIPRDETRLRTEGPVVEIETFECLSTEPLDAAFCRSLAGRIIGYLVPMDGLAVLRPSPHRPADPTNFRLTGTLSRAEDVVRITASLEGPDGGPTIWVDRYDIRLVAAELHAQEDGLASAIASQIGDPVIGAVARSNRDSLEPGPSRAVESFYKYLRGPSPEALANAKRSLEQRMPDGGGHALLHAAYACVLLLEQVGASGDIDAVASADAHARSAVLDNAQSSLAHLARALVSYQRRERTLARQSALRAVDTAGTSPFLRAAAGNILALVGEPEAGLPLVSAAFETCPELPRYLRFAECVIELLDRGAPASALPLAGEVATVLPFWGHLLEAACLATLGRPVDARRAAGLSTQASAERLSAQRIEKAVRAVLFDEVWAGELLSAASDAGLIARTAHHGPSRFSVAIGARRKSSEIRIGILHSLSGPMALCESHLVNAAMLAIDEINRDGGILGRPVRPIVEDGASQPSTFARKAEALVRDGTEHVFGCWMSSCRKAVLPAVESANALLWYPMQYEGLEQSKNVVYTGSCLNQQIEPAVRWAMKQGHMRCLLVGSDYVFPRTAHRLIRGLVESQGGQILGDFHEPLGQGNFERVAQLIAAEKPDIVYNTVNGVDNIALFEALGRAGVRAANTQVLSFSLSEIELAKLSGKATGHLACWSYFQSFTTPENLSLVARFRARYGRTEVLSDPVATAYAQVHLLKEVAERIGDFDSHAIRAALPGSIMNLGGEALRIRDNYHVERRATIGRATANEQFEIVWRGTQLIEPEPWFGVDQANLIGRELILEALRALPEMAERTSLLETQVKRQLGGRESTVGG